MRITLVGILLALAVHLSAQPKEELLLNAVFPYAGNLIVNGDEANPRSISSYKGEYIIIDLFGSSCKVCFAALPKLQALQDQFKGKMRFLLVGADDAKIRPLYEKFKSKLSLTLDVAFDKELFRNIQFTAFPTYIWLNPAGNIIAVTGPYELSAASIERFIKGESPGIKNLQRLEETNPQVPYLFSGNGGSDTNFLFRSLLCPGNPNLRPIAPHRLSFFKPGNTFNLINVPEDFLYRYAYWGRTDWLPDDSMYGKAIPEPIWLDENSDTLHINNNPQRYCYSAAWRGHREPDLASVMRTELHNYFGYEARLVRRSMPYYSVRRKDNGVRVLETIHTSTSRNLSMAGLSYERVLFRDVMQLAGGLHRSLLPLIDETGIDYPVDLHSDLLLTPPDALIQVLREAGLLVDIRYKEMQVLEIRAWRKDIAKE